MPDLPERVWVSPLGVFPVEMGGSVPYVPESALRAAEAERDAVQSEMATWRMIAQGNGERARLGDAMLVEERAENAALRARVAALEAERDEWKARAFSAEERHRNEMNLHDTQEAMLAAEREALVPLAQLTMDLADAALVLPEELTDAQLAAARAVLAKEGT